jgi:hypothetical protein
MVNGPTPVVADFGPSCRIDLAILVESRAKAPAPSPPAENAALLRICCAGALPDQARARRGADGVSSRLIPGFPTGNIKARNSREVRLGDTVT